MEKLTKERILKFKEHFNEIYHSLNDVINRVVHLKSSYGDYQFNYDSIMWEYDGESFEVEASEYYGTDRNYASVSWDDIINVDELKEKLKTEADERQKEKEKKEKIKKEEENRRKEEAERKHYEELKAKFEK